MAKFKSYDYRQRVLLPVSLEDQLMSGTLEFAIHTLVDKRLDMSIFEGKYRNDETGRAAYDPKILLKVVLLAYSRGLISSRKIEQACRENVVFMALACGQQPDHSTIAAFVSSLKDEILPLFRDVLLVCEEMNLLGGHHVCLGWLQVAFQRLERVERHFYRATEEKAEDRGPGGATAGRADTNRPRAEMNLLGPGLPAPIGSSWWRSCKRRQS